MKNKEITSLDVDQIWKRVYDEKTDSLRNSLAGAEIKVDIDTESLSNSIKEAIGSSFLSPQVTSSVLPEIKFQELQVIVKETEVVHIDKVVTDTKTVIERIEVPVIVKEIEYKTVEMPIYIPEIKIIEIEKPIVAAIQLPKWFNVLLIIQTLAIIGLIAGQLRR